MKHKLFRLFFVLTFVIGLAMVSTPQSARAAGPWYVSTTGDDNNDCQSPATPCATIDGAIGKAFDGDTINVATGIYTGNSFYVVTIAKSLTLSGGWDSMFVTNNGVSTIDGQNVRRGVSTNEYYYIITTIDRFVIQNSLIGITATYDTVTLNNSAVINNTGGGINVVGVLTLNNSTVSGNQTTGSGGGIAFFNQTGAPLTLNNSTIANNSASQGGGVSINVYGSPQPTAILQNSIIANNTATLGPDCYGIINSSDHNIIGNISDCTVNAGVGDQFNVDPMLGAFVLSQGYYPLLPDSPAIDAGNYATCLPTDQRGVTRPQGVACDIGSFELEQTPLPPPANDNFANAEVIGTLPSNVTVNTIWAGVEPGEVQYCYTSQRTVWYSFNPTTTGAVRVDMAGSGFNNTVIKIYQAVGPGIGGLNFITCAAYSSNSATFKVQAGETYYIEAGGIDYASGALQLNLQEASPPANDDFGNASTINSLPFSSTVNNTDATTELNEPYDDCAFTFKTIWYSFMPAANMTVRADTLGSSFANPQIKAYQDTGSGIGGLSFLTCAASGNPATLNLQAGVTYYFQVGSMSFESGDLLLNLQEIFPPANDNFSNATIISALPFADAVNNTDASAEIGEPQYSYYSPKTVWYSFTPAVQTTVKADMLGSSFSDTILNIYQATGSGFEGLSFLANAYYGNSSTVSFQAGVTYYFQAGSIDSGGGDLQLNLLEIFPPANDNLANAEAITSLPFSATVDITKANIELDEVQSCDYLYQTIWYSFTPAQTIFVRANTQGSSIYWTNVNVYSSSGPGMNNLNALGCGYYGNSVDFLAEAGQTYYLQVSPIINSSGNIQINIEQFFPPANDNFASAETITSLPFNATANIVDATNEANEPQWCYSSPNTVWYSFTPSANALVKADMTGSSFSDTIFNVYQLVGSGINGLSFQQCAYYGNSTTFNVQAGVTYYIQAGSINNSGGDLHLNLQEIPRPANADFANAIAVTSLPFSATPDVTNGGVEPYEPQSCYYMSDTVWYSFTPTVKTLVSANTLGSAINSNLNVYHDTGSGISGLNLVPSGCTYNYGTVTFIAEAGQTYYFQAGGIYGQAGSMSINLEQLPLPANDDFANAAIASLPLPFDNTVDTQYSTRQTGEPTASCAGYGPGTRSVWYAFTPTTSGSFSASIFGYAFTPVFAAYTGSSMGNLTQVGCQTYTGNQLTFHANASTTYYFQVGNLYPWEQGGPVQFHLDVTLPPQASFYTNPWDPSKYDTVQFQDNSYDPGQVGFQTYTWNFGDGTTASGYSATHKYATDGNYQVTHTVTTVDGRTATVTQTVQVRTHDVAITKIAAPNSANVGQTKTITVTLRNIAYPETVQIDLYKSTPNGFVWVATITKAFPALSGNRTTAVNFSYTFTSDDAKLGKVTFKAVATIVGARDAYPSDNEAISLITKVAK